MQGRADAYVHVTFIKKWDICAGNAIITSMNGRMTTLEGRAIDYSDGDAGNNDGLLATLKDHDKFVKNLKPAFDDLKKKAQKQ